MTKLNSVASKLVEKAAESVVKAVYVREGQGNDTTKTYSFGAEGDTIVYRNASGRTQVSTPVTNDDAVNKAYADKFEQKYLSLTGESGTLDDNQYPLVTGYDNLIIQRSGVDFRRSGHPFDNQGDYVFVAPYLAQPNGTEEWVDYFITIKTDRTWTFTIKNNNPTSAQSYEQTEADDATIIRDGKVMKQFATFDMTGNSEKVWSFPYSYDADKKPMCWVNCVAEGNSVSNGAAVISNTNSSMTVRLCGVNSKVTFYSEGFKTTK